MRIFYCGSADADFNRIQSHLSGLDLAIEVIPQDAARYGLRDLSDQISGLMPVVLPDVSDCRSVLIGMRKTNKISPVMVVRSQGAPGAAALLDAGADDVVDLSQPSDEIFARLRAICRKRAALDGDDGLIRVGPFSLDAQSGQIIVGDAEPGFTRTERSIMRILSLSWPKPVTRNALYDALYGLSYDPPLPKAVDMHIFKLRRRLARAMPGGDRILATCPGQGYRLCDPSQSQPKAA